jgi:deoxyribodipyrimidine photolyase-related protein
MQHIILILPHQLFEITEYQKILNTVKQPCDFYIVEDCLFFKDDQRKLKFNLLKLIYQRACMKYYADYLMEQRIKVNYIDYVDDPAYFYKFINQKYRNKQLTIHMYDATDRLFQKRLEKYCKKYDIDYHIYHTPYFICNEDELFEYMNKRKSKRLFHKSFYEWQRKKLNILMTDAGQPIGGSFSYDKENRLKLPSGSFEDFIKQEKITVNEPLYQNKYYDEAIKYCEKTFRNYYGELYEKQNVHLYPCTHADALKHFESFLKTKLNYFGPYEDYVDKKELYLFHSALSPMLNNGLLTPMFILKRTLVFYAKYKKNLDLASVEGFIRQLFWREYMRMLYINDDVYARMVGTNYLRNENRMNSTWYTGKTGVKPIDWVIKCAFRYGYIHHIIRLMFMCNFMNLCGINPDDCYKWFMEFSLDSYDWVMIGNVYGMGLYADGGTVTTRPYVSSSNYIVSMSNFRKDGIWDVLWTELYHKFVNDNFSKLKGLGYLYKSSAKKLTKSESKEVKEFIDSVTK